MKPKGKTKQLTLKQFFNEEKRSGQTQDNVDYLNLHYALGIAIMRELNPKKVLEIGPGPGALLEFFTKQSHINAVGLDINKYSREYFLDRNPDFENNYKLVDMLNYNFEQGDVVISIEVFEHIPDEVLDIILPKLAKKYKYFWFSSTPKLTNPEQDKKWGHINVKYNYEWVIKMKRYGWDFERWRTIPTEWSMVFKSKYRE